MLFCFTMTRILFSLWGCWNCGEENGAGNQRYRSHRQHPPIILEAVGGGGGMRKILFHGKTYNDKWVQGFTYFKWTIT